MVREGGEALARLRPARVVRAWIGVLLLAAAMALAACGGSDSDSSDSGGSTSQTEGRTGGTVVWAKPVEGLENDPTTAIGAPSWQMLFLVYEGLVGMDDELRPTPKLATSWEQTSPTTYVFTLRRGVRFSNGREMTVDDVVGTLERLADPRTAADWARQVGIKSVSAKGPGQVEVVLSKPNASFIPAMAAIPAAILPMKELQARSFDPRKDLLGTGPFKVVSHRPNEVWNLARNTYYWQPDEPRIDRLTVRIVPDDAARVAGLRDGSLDIATFDTVDAANLLEGQSGVATYVMPTNDYYRLDVNSISSMFKDPRLREALSLALDREEIRDVALAGIGEPSAAVPPGFGVCDPSDVPHGDPDVERAAQLVEEAGAKGKAVSVIGSPLFKPYVQIAQVVQSQLEAIGFDVKVEQLSEGEWLEREFGPNPDFDLAVSYLVGHGDPAMPLAYWGPDQAWTAGWKPADDELNALIEQSRTDPAGSTERQETLRAACDRVAENGQMIPLVTKPLVVAYRSDAIDASFPKLEGYSSAMRNAARFGANGG